MKNQKKRKISSSLGRWIFFMLVLFQVMSVWGQEITARGKIVDQNGEPLIGVTVVAVGDDNGVISDVDGNFTLKCVRGAKLRFSFIGYSDVEQVTLGDFMKIVMKEDVQALDEVVVVGYGTQKKRDITGSITSVSASTIQEKQPVDVYQALQGAAPGLQISNNSGAPGATGTMLIRGASTMGSGVNPLYIVDGVPVSSISDINPSDIESLEVLKDAASAAIYGSRSAAGVIIITTKRGEEGTPIRVSAKYNHSIKTLDHKLDQANAFDRFIFERRVNPGTSLWKTSNDSLHPNFMADNDYQDLVTRAAHTDQIDVNISGTKNKVRYYTSLGYLNQQGIVINSWYKRLTTRTNVDYQATDNIKFLTRFNVSYTNRNNINTGQVLQQAMKRPPSMALYFPDGSYIYNNGGQFNPIADAYERINETTAYNFQLYQGAEIKLFKYLTWNGNVQGNYSISRVDGLVPANLTALGVTTGNNTASLARKLAAETYLNYNQDFGDHNVNAMFGASVEDWYDEGFRLYGSNYVSESIISSNAQEVKDLANTYSSFSDHAMAAFFGRFGYSYKSRYIFSSNIRYDGSSRFVGKRWGLFPSASAAWRFSDESFFQWAKPILTDGKFRVSWGMTGNERVGNYDAINTYSIGNYYNGSMTVTQKSQIANVDLSWEATEQTNLGLDLTFLDGRINFTADYYVKNTHDLLAVENMPSELGVTSMRVNFGKIQNKGVELSVTAYPVQTRDFSWQTSFNYTHNKNEVKELAGGIPYVEGGKYWIEEGSPLGQWYGWRYQGIYATDEANAYVKNGDGSFGERLTPVYQTDPNNYGNIVYGTNGKPIFSHYETSNGQRYDGEVGQMTTYGQVLKGGDVIWDDVDHDGVIGDKDRQILGEGLPTWYIGWSNNFNYKNFALSFSFYGSFGNKIYNQQRRSLNQYSSSNVTPMKSDIYKMWKYQGQITEGYSGAKATTGVVNARELSSYYLESGDYIRLTNIRLSYTLDKKWAKFLKVNDLSVYVYGNNLLTWTDYTGYDPSSISNSNVLQPGIDNGRYPTAKEYGFGLNVNF